MFHQNVELSQSSNFKTLCPPQIYTVRTRKLWNRKTTLKQFGSFFDTKQIVSLVTYLTKLSERFAPIFYFHCEHFFFVHCETKSKQKVCGFFKKFSWFFNIFKNRILMKANFWGPTNGQNDKKQTDKQSIYILGF